MAPSKRIRIAVVGLFAVGLTALAVAAILLRPGTPAEVRPGSGSPRPSPSVSTTPAPSVTAGATAVTRRVVDVLESMHGHAFNPEAPPAKGSTLPGGLFINWRGTWDGNLDTAAENTNVQTSGLSDDTTGALPRHDPVTDLLYLRNLYGYRAAYPADHAFDGDISRIDPIVRSEFSGYTYYRAWLYFEMRDLDRFGPGRGWDGLALRYATGLFLHYYDKSLGTIVDPAHGTYRTDFAAEAGAALLDAGQRYGRPEWTAAGRSTVAHLLARSRNPTTNLFPLQFAISGSSETVAQAQVKVGAEAQLLDALLTAYELTGDAADLHAVQVAVASLFGPQLGVWDESRGAFYFSVNADGTDLRTAYRETRQAWMLPLLQHLDRIEHGAEALRTSQMLVLVRDRLWQQAFSGYLYRVDPDFGVYINDAGPGHSPVEENYVTTEAMGIAAQALEGTWANAAGGQ